MIDGNGPSGYSGTPQARKLGLKPGLRVALDGAPSGWMLDNPPALEWVVDGPADVIIAFFRSSGELAQRLPGLAQRIFPAGGLWITWPRRAAGHISDVTDNVVREHVLPLGLVDVKVAAVDEDWSGLRVVWRVENRAPADPVLGRRPPPGRGVE